MSVPTIRIVIADDQPMLRKGLALLLGDEPDIRIVGEAGDGGEAIEMCRCIHPDVVLMDLSMPRVSGLHATRRIAEELPDVKVIALSMHEETDMAESMREAGAAVYMIKGGPVEELLAAIRRLKNG